MHRLWSLCIGRHFGIAVCITVGSHGVREWHSGETKVHRDDRLYSVVVQRGKEALLEAEVSTIADRARLWHAPLAMTAASDSSTTKPKHPSTQAPFGHHI